MLTILTDPVGSIKADSRLWIKKHVLHRTWGGHSAVTRSLIEGFEKIGFNDYNLNPYFESQIGDCVHVLAGVKTLRYAIELKKEGKIKHLTAGPNVVVFSTDVNGLIASNEIDLYLQPAQWACDIHVLRKPELINRCLPWPAGVDISRLNPVKFEKRSGQVLLYHKRESAQIALRAKKLLEERGYNVVWIEYGSYKLDDYIELLGQSEFVVFVDCSESQGLCLAEAWAMNVMTFCFDPQCYRWEYSNETYDYYGTSTAPYLTEATGAKWFELSELNDILDHIDDLKSKAHPRKWVEENMTDEVCARNFLRLIGVQIS